MKSIHVLAIVAVMVLNSLARSKVSSIASLILQHTEKVVRATHKVDSTR